MKKLLFFKHRILYLSFVMMCIFVVGCSIISQNNQKNLKKELQVFSENKIHELIKRCNKGDGDACFILSDYYIFEQKDNRKGFFWLKKAAELGNLMAQYNLNLWLDSEKTNTLNKIDTKEPKRKELIKSEDFDGYTGSPFL